MGTPAVSSFSVLVVSLMLGLIGLALVPRLSVQLMPSRSHASVSVYCSMGEASPELTDMELTVPIERTLAQLRGVQHIRSTSGRGTAVVQVSLDKWTNPAVFRFEAATVLRHLYRKLPATASYPVAYLNRPAENSAFRSDIIGYTLGGPGTQEDIAHMAERRIRPVLVNIRGIYAVNISGAQPKRIAVEADIPRLGQVGIPLEKLETQLREGFLSKGLGAAASGGERPELAIERGIADLRGLNGYPVRNDKGQVFSLRDLAKVDIRETPPTSHYRINGEQLVHISVVPEEHVNNIELAGRIREAMLAAGERLADDGFRLDMVYDNTEYIKEELGKIYLRTGLSVAILLLFVLLITRKGRYLVLVVLSLAVNVAVSLVLYFLFRLEIHLYSLAGITISLGLVIDNVIVIVEDIRHTGRNRIFAAILASTLTALGALSVIFLLDEATRINLFDFGMAVIINLLVSLPVAYYFIPALLERLPVRIAVGRSFFRRRRLIVRFSRLYDRQLRFMFRFRWGFLLLFLLCFGLPTFLLPENVRENGWWAKAYNAVFGSELYNQTLRKQIDKYAGGILYLYISNLGGNGRGAQSEDRVRLEVVISMPNGATLEQMDEVARGFERFIGQFSEEVERFETRVSDANSASISILFNKGHEGVFPHQLKQRLEIQAIQAGAADFKVFGLGQSFDNAIKIDKFDSSFQLRGYNYQQLRAIAMRVRDSISANPRVQDALVTTLNAWEHRRYEEFVVRMDRPERLAVYGIAPQAMDGALKAIDQRESYIGTLRTGPNVFTHVELLTNSARATPIWSALNAPLAVRDSLALRLADVAKVEKIRLGDAIVRDNQEYLINVHYRFIGSHQLHEYIRERMVNSIEPSLPYGYHISIPDWYHDWWRGGGGYTYLWLIGLVLLIIYMICAVLLESFAQPFAVVLMIPFSFIGVFLTFHFLSLRFDQGGYAALLMLSGLVTNAALYIINDFNHLRRSRGGCSGERRRLYVRAFNAKAMPILVTTFSAILSLLPFMISGEEKGFWFTLSAGTIGGLLFSVIGVYLLLPICLLTSYRSLDFFGKSCISQD